MLIAIHDADAAHFKHGKKGCRKHVCCVPALLREKQTDSGARPLV